MTQETAGAQATGGSQLAEGGGHQQAGGQARVESMAAAPAAALAHSDNTPKAENSRFEGLANSLFIEQYKANRTEILTGFQTSQRIFQFAVTAFVGLNSIAVGFILKSPILSVFDGYVLAGYYGVVVTISMLVFSISWFMEMLRLTRATLFLKYIEDRIGSFLSAGEAGGRDLFRDRFDGFVVFSEKWLHGEMKSNHFDYVGHFPYLYNLIFLAAVCAASAATGEAFFINAILSDRLAGNQFTQPMELISLNPLAVLPGATGWPGGPHIAILLWVNFALVLAIVALACSSIYSVARTALNVMRASRAEGGAA